MLGNAGPTIFNFMMDVGTSPEPQKWGAVPGGGAKQDAGSLTSNRGYVNEILCHGLEMLS
jgi:hypothetical protein